MALSEQLDQELRTAALLPRDDPYRAAVVSQIAGNLEARELWESLTNDRDALLAELANVPPPTSNLSQSFTDRLLEIPYVNGTKSTEPFWRRPLGWRELRFAAAILLIVVAIYGSYVGVQTLRERQVAAQQDRAASQIARLVVQSHIVGAGGQINSGESEKVAAVLAGANMPFVPSILPAKEGAELVGGGIDKVDGKTVAVTRWKRGEEKFTLYEFVPSEFGLDSNFPTQSRSPTDLWNGEKHYVVQLWANASAGCGWALVCERENQHSPVSRGGHYY